MCLYNLSLKLAKIASFTERLMKRIGRFWAGYSFWIWATPEPFPIKLKSLETLARMRPHAPFWYRFQSMPKPSCSKPQSTVNSRSLHLR